MNTKTNTPKAHRKVIARVPFFDVVLDRHFKSGEEVIGWNEQRIAHYEKRGTVHIINQPEPEEVK